MMLKPCGPPHLNIRGTTLSSANAPAQMSYDEDIRIEDTRIRNPSLCKSSSNNNMDEDEQLTLFPNRWARFRHVIREPAAEFLGTMILVIFGNGVNGQVILSANASVSPSGPKGSYESICLAWGIGTALGVWVSGGISGGHINPAVTLALATFRRFPWWKVPVYWVAQVLGGFAGAALVYAQFYHAINVYEGGPGIRTVPGTAQIFATFPATYMTPVSSCFDEFFGVAILVLVIFAITDKRNGPPPAGLVPLVLFFTVSGVGMSWGMNTAFAINPARDLGPRLLTWCAGYGREVWNFQNQWWLYTPLLGCLAGGLAGGFVYDAFCFTGEESIFNTPDARTRRLRAHAPQQEREKMPGGVEA